MVSSFSISLSGMNAAAKRVHVAASNIANSRNSIALADMASDHANRPGVVHNMAVAGGGVRTVVMERDPPYAIEFAPGDARADGDGLVARPNTDLAMELVGMMQAENAYSANAAALRTQDEMFGSLLDMKT